MSIVDAFSREDRVEVKFSDFYNIIKQAAQKENIMNGVNCNVPHEYIREMVTGKAEEPTQEIEAQEATIEIEAGEYSVIVEATRCILAEWDDAEEVQEVASHIIGLVDTMTKARIHEIIMKNAAALEANDEEKEEAAAGEEGQQEKAEP